MYLSFFHLLVPGFGYCLVVSWFYFYFPSFSSSVSLTDEEPKVWANFCYFETVLFNDFSKNSSSSPSKIFVSERIFNFVLCHHSFISFRESVLALKELGNDKRATLTYLLVF